MRFAAFPARTFQGTAASDKRMMRAGALRDPRSATRTPRRMIPVDSRSASPRSLPSCRWRAGLRSTTLPPRCQGGSRVETGRLRRLQGLAPSSGPVARSRRCRRDHGSVLPWASFPFKILLMVAGAPCSHHPPRHGRETMPRSSVLTPAGAPRRRVACRPPPSRCQEDVGCCARWASTWTARATAEAIAESEVSAQPPPKRRRVPRTGRACTGVHGPWDPIRSESL
jgi:hypothetical protein